MPQPRMPLLHRVTVAMLVLLPPVFAARGQGAPEAAPPPGQRIFVAGHSFHVPSAQMLDQICRSAKIPGHQLAGVQSIGGSTVTQHWDKPEATNKARQAI